MLALAVAGALVATFIATILPNRYESRATLLIEPQTISTKLVEPNLSETELNSRLHLISMQILSRSRLSKVIDEFDVYPDLDSKLTREEIIDRMRADISVVPLLSDLEAAHIEFRALRDYSWTQRVPSIGVLRPDKLDQVACEIWRILDIMLHNGSLEVGK